MGAIIVALTTNSMDRFVSKQLEVSNGPLYIFIKHSTSLGSAKQDHPDMWAGVVSAHLLPIASHQFRSSLAPRPRTLNTDTDVWSIKPSREGITCFFLLLLALTSVPEINVFLPFNGCVEQRRRGERLTDSIDTSYHSERLFSPLYSGRIYSLFPNTRSG